MATSRKKYVPQRVIQGRVGSVMVTTGTEDSGILTRADVDTHKKANVGLDIVTGDAPSLQDKVVLYVGPGQVIVPDTGYTGLSSVTLIDSDLEIQSLTCVVDNQSASTHPLVDCANSAYRLAVYWTVSTTEDITNQFISIGGTSTEVPIDDRSYVFSGTFISSQDITLRVDTASASETKSISVKWVTPIWWGKLKSGAVKDPSILDNLENKKLSIDTDFPMSWNLSTDEYAYIVSDASWGTPKFISNESGWNEEFKFLGKFKYTDKVNLNVYRSDYPSLGEMDFIIKYTY